MTYGPSTRTVLDVRTAVQRAFGDESGVQLQDSDIIMWINDAQDEIVNRNKILKGTGSFSSVIGQAEYSFDPTVRIHEVEALHYDGARLPNMSMAQAEETILSEQGVTPQSGAPVLWYEWGGKFTLWPIPDAVKSIVLYYTLRPARITVTTDLLSVPDKYYQTLVNYVLQKAYEMDEDWSASQVKGQQFDAQIADMGEEERTAQNMTYSTITLFD